MENKEPKQGAKSDTPVPKTGNKSGNLPEVEKLATALGIGAEMAHIFFMAMISAGASQGEAAIGMNGFIQAWWGSIMKQAGQEGQKKEDGDE